MMLPVFTLTLEPRPGSILEHLCVESQRLADALRVYVKFKANGVDCIARPDGDAVGMLKNLENAFTLVRPKGIPFFVHS